MISPADYISIANIIGKGNDDMDVAVASVSSLISTLESITMANTDAQSNLSLAALQCSNLLTQNKSISQKMQAALQALQSHVVRNAGSVDLFLSSNNIKVTQSFANLSAQGNYPINSSNILP